MRIIDWSFLLHIASFLIVVILKLFNLLTGCRHHFATRWGKFLLSELQMISSHQQLLLDLQDLLGLFLNMATGTHTVGQYLASKLN